MTIYSHTYPKPLVISPKMPDLKDYCTTEVAAKKLGFNVVHVRAMIRDKKLNGLKVGRTWLVAREAIAKYLKDTAGMSKHDPHRSSIK